MRRGSLSCEVTRPKEELSRFWLPVLNRVRLRRLKASQRKSAENLSPNENFLARLTPSLKTGKDRTFGLFLVTLPKAMGCAGKAARFMKRSVAVSKRSPRRAPRQFS